jgi:hypothetical protein
MVPFWDPLNPPIKAGSPKKYLDYPTDYDINKGLPDPHDPTSNLWGEDDHVFILSVKRFFDIIGVYNSYMDDDIF